MAASIEQKVDYLLKKIGYTASKTGIAEDESSLTGTKKAPFAEALPSPLVVPSTSIYGQSESIPSTPPGTTSGVVQVYGTATAFQMTEDNTVSGQRAWLARSVQGDNTSDMAGDWIDTQFGPDYIVNVYAGDPNAGGTKLSAAGSGSNDTWFFDYSSGVLNFNGDAVPTAVTGGADVYLVGYRYTGLKGTSGADGSFTNLNITGVATFASDIQANGNIIGDGSTNISGIDSVTAASYFLQDGSNVAQNVFTVSGTDVSLNGVDAIDATTRATLESALSIAPNEFNDIVVSGLSTFNGDIDLNGDIVGSNNNVVSGIGTLQVGILTATQATLGAGSTMTGKNFIETLSIADGLEVSGVTTFNGTSIDINGNGDVSGNLNVGGDLTVAGTLAYEDVTNIDSVGLITARAGIDVLANGINVQAGVVTSTDGFEGDLTGDVTGNLTGEVNAPAFDTNADGVVVTGIATATGFSGPLVGNVTGNLTGEVDAAAFDTNADGTVTTGIATATGFSGPLVGDVTGNVTGNLTGEVDAAAFDTNADGIVVTGVATATAFVGDGSGLTNIDAALNGQDVSVRHAQVGGALTVTGATDLNGDLDVDGLTNLDEVNIAGVATGVQFNIGNTAVLETVNGQVSLSGIATLDATTKATIEREIALAPNDFSSLNIVGLSTFGGAADFNGGIDVTGGSTSDELNVTGVATVGGTLEASGGADLSGGVLVDVLGVTGVATVAGNLLANANLDVTNHTTLNTLRATGLSTFVSDVQINGDLTANGDITGDGATNITGINSVTATEFYGDGSNLTGLGAGLDGLNVTLGDVTVGGALTVTGDTDLNGGLDVDGHTELDELRVSGVSTFQNGVNFNDNIAVTGQTTSGSLVVNGASTLTGEVSVGSTLTVTDDIIANGNIEGNGGTNIIGINDLTSTGTAALGSVTAGGTLDVTGETTLSDVSVGAALTVAGTISANGNIEGDGATNISGINSVTADFFYGDGSGITNINSAIDGLDIAPRHINAAGFATVAQGLEVTSGGADITGLTTVTGDLYVTGNTTLGDADSDTLTVNADVASDLIPDGNNTRDLGAISDRWANIYAGDVNTTTLDVANNVTIGGNLSVGGTITSAELVELDIIAPVIELGLESVGDGTLQPPSSQTNYSSGLAMWYNRVGVSSDNAQAAAMFADVKPTGTYRIGFATDVTIGSGDVLGAVNGWAEIEAGGLWMNDCAGESVVINCTGTERFLNNITVDGGSF